MFLMLHLDHWNFNRASLIVLGHLPRASNACFQMHLGCWWNGWTWLSDVYPVTLHFNTRKRLGWNGIKCAGGRKCCVRTEQTRGSVHDKWQFAVPAAISNIIIKCGVILHLKALASPSILSAQSILCKWMSSCWQTKPKPGMINHLWLHDWWREAAAVCSALCLHPLALSLE